MFFIQKTEVCNFANETIIYTYSPNFEEATPKISIDMHLILNCLYIIYILYINYIITQYINKIETRRSLGTKILGVPGIKK